MRILISIMVLMLLIPSLAQETPGPSTDINETGQNTNTNAETGKRFIYIGSVEIENKSLANIIDSLKKSGCGTQGTLNGCYFEETEIPTEYDSPVNGTAVQTGSEAKEESTPGIKIIIVHPNGATFGPDNLILTESRLYASRDMEGPLDEDKYKTEVRKTIEQLNNFILIQEDTWEIKSQDSSDIVYSAGERNDPRLVQFIIENESKTDTLPIFWWILLGIAAILGVGAFIYKRRNNSNLL